MPSLLDRIPDQSGRIALITGGTRGLGLEAATALAYAGATVIVSGRSEQTGADAVSRLESLRSTGSAEFLQLDVSDSASVEEVATAVAARGRLDLLINNAGVMAPPLSFSADGDELQWATNVLGPFSLTSRLLPVITRTAGSRIVTVSSIAHRVPPFTVQRARLEMQGSRYRPFLVYGHTKLANVLVARELDRRLRAVGSSTLSVVAHPGAAGTDLPRATLSEAPAPVRNAALRVWKLISADPADAVESILSAAIAPLIRGGDMIGPRALGQSRGKPARVQTSRAAGDEQLARELVGWLERVTGTRLDP